MKKTTIFLAAAIVILTLAGCVNLNPTNPGGEKPAPTPAVDWDNREVYRGNLFPGEQAVLDDLSAASVYHIRVVIGDDLRELTGQMEVRYTNQEETALDEVHFQLFPNLSGGRTTLSAVRVDGEIVAPEMLEGGAAAVVRLPRALQPGEQAVLSMDFRVTIPDQVGGNYGLFGYFNNVLVLDGFYPAIPVFDQRGWNSGPLPPNADSTYQDASFYLVTVDAPEDLVLVASGSEVERAAADGRQRVTFAAGPARDFYLAASPDFIRVSGKTGDTVVNCYVLPGREQTAREALKTALDALEIFSRLIGPYPYSELDVVSTPMQGAIGIEYPGVTGINLVVFDPQGQLSGRPAVEFLESTVAHEVGHQWFYNAVGNDQIHEPWVDEALVQYITGLYFREMYGEEGYQSARQSWLNRWQRTGNAEIPIGKPAGDYDGREYGAIVYGRGPLFFEALNKEIGDDVFSRFLQRYYTSQKWDIASGEELQQTAEQRCGCDLDALFARWVTP